MSIAPPSDIILDVAQAADPQRLVVATAKLNGMAGPNAAAGPDDFPALLARAAGATPKAVKSAAGSTLMAQAPSSVQASPSPYRKFEAMLLQTFVQEMLPKDENLFGDAASADICRSMLAEQLATQLSKSDKFGIARMIEKAHGAKTTATASTAAVPAAAPPAAAASAVEPG